MADEQTADPPKINIGSMISEKIAESVRNMDVVSMIQKMVATTPEDEESEEAREKLLGVLDKYNAMTDEDKEQFATKMKELLASKLSLKLQDPNINFSGLEQALSDAIMSKLYMIAAGALLFFILIVFFGYKLYKSIKDKEKKREEKKKAKQMKKKK